jgi:pSer/pThr/pTyr-binding forkhead associated (FHA) protein
MFAKIEIASQEPVTYNLSKSDIIVGSSPNAHIIIIEKTISKKHVRLVTEDNAWFVVDQGSTNGSFFDGEQLVPGKKVKIAVDEPVGLGSKVFLTLVNEAENAKELSEPAETKSGSSSAQSSISSEADRTRVISLDDLKNAKAVADQKRVLEQKAKRAAETKRKRAEQARMGKIAIACAVVFGVGIWANNKFKEKLKYKPRETIVKKIQQKAKADEEILTDIEGFRISRATLFPRNRIIKMFKDTKCVSDEAKEFCGEVSALATNDNGVIFLKPATYVIYLEENEQMDILRKILSPNTVLNYDALQKLLFFNVFKQKLGDKTVSDKAAFYFSFYNYDSKKEPQLNYVIGVAGATVPVLMSELKDMQFTLSDEQLKTYIDKADQYFTTY